METVGLSVIVPLYNEAGCLDRSVRQIVAELEELGESSWELLLVDDGSRDDTRARAATLAAGDPRIRLLSHDPNQGKGATVRQGMLAGRGELLLFLDADLSTPLRDLRLLRLALDATPADIAIGSRALPSSRLQARQPPVREALGRLGNLAIRLLTPSLADLHDTQCGFKLFRRAAAQRVFAGSRIDRWGFDFEVLALARHLGYRVVEVGVSWRHDPHSKVRSGDYLRTLADLVRLRLDPAWPRVDRRPPAR
ncbi:MAG: glycosyltransferase family 2 protein [Myxococcota bacterium]|jgi:dolichyl-phosphate beta-glucosyltransferase|nr:glycosyltransferase family 2 protein [Myxococcota bacterium]